MQPDKWFDYNDTHIYEFYAGRNGKNRFWHSNRTPKSIRVHRLSAKNDTQELIYHKMSEIDYPMRSLYCWDFTKQHKHFFNQNYQQIQLKV